MISLVDLPFDQYTRHRIVASIADEIRREHRVDQLHVLDVGGFPCLTPQFIPADRVTVIDVVRGRTDELASYVQADGSALPFRDQSFDLVVSLDSLEHVPQGKRTAYVDELLRVGRSYVLIVAPFARDITVLAEKLLAEFVRVVNQEEQPQLREHRAYGLPKLSDWVAHFEDRGLPLVTFDSGYVFNWLPMMLLKHYVLSLPDSESLHLAIDRFYNEALGTSDRRAPGYRQGMLISLKGPTRVLDTVGDLLAASGEPDRLEVIERMEQIGLLLKLADLHVASRKDDRLREDVLAKQQHIINIEAELQSAQSGLESLRLQSDAQLASERARATELELELADLRAHIEAIRNGRVMRLLSALPGRGGKST